MPSEQHWIVNDALGLLLRLSRACCLAPIRFVENRSASYVYISRSLSLFSLVMVIIIHLSTIYHLYLWVHTVERENYSDVLLIIFNISNVILFVSFAILHSNRRMRNYMTLSTILRRVIKSLHNNEETNIKKWHVLMIFIVLSGGVNFVLVFSRSLSYLTCLLILELSMVGVYQQQFMYFAIYINFALKLIQDELQEELAKIIYEDGKKHGDFDTPRFNIPLEYINKAIDTIGRNNIFLPNLKNTGRQDIAQRVRQIKDCYVSTCDALREINSSDNVLLFLQIIYIALSMVFTSYRIIKLLQQGDSSLLFELLIHGLHFILLIIQIVMFVEPCHVAHEKITKIRFLVCEITCYVSSESDPILIELREFFKQLVLIDISYTALGICNIERTLIPSIIGVVTTVLIMVFEF